MARLILSKSSLQRQRNNLKLYRRYLPSLDLKRRQLMAERMKAAAALSATEKKLSSERSAGERIPMLSNREVDIQALVRVEGVEETEENVVGTVLPRLGSVVLVRRPYSRLARPQWVDVTAAALERRLELEIRARVEKKRLQLLEKAVRRITQRVNLFEKVLIPRTRTNIRRIQIFLGDAERAAVVRAKMAKKLSVSEGARDA
jgi:V/A-type H+-transporting ATPase subunit D